MQAITVAMVLNPNTHKRATNNNCLSVNLSFAKGRIKFSEKIAAGARIAELVVLIMADSNRHFVVTVSANSMKPKDEVSERNEALELWKAQALDPITLFKRLDFPDPMETAKQMGLWVTNPQLYMQTMFPELAQAQPQDSANPQNPTDVTGGQPGGPPPGTVSQEPANASLSSVPLPQ